MVRDRSYRITDRLGGAHHGGAERRRHLQATVAAAVGAPRSDSTRGCAVRGGA
jgi:hypothetical protein